MSVFASTSARRPPISSPRNGFLPRIAPSPYIGTHGWLSKIVCQLPGPVARSMLGERRIQLRHAHDEAFLLRFPEVVRREDVDGVALDLRDHVGDAEAPGLDFGCLFRVVARKARRGGAAVEGLGEFFAVRRHADRELVRLYVVARDAQRVEMAVAGAEQDAIVETIQSAAARCRRRDHAFVRADAQRIERGLHVGRHELRSLLRRRERDSTSEYRDCEQRYGEDRDADELSDARRNRERREQRDGEKYGQQEIAGRGEPRQQQRKQEQAEDAERECEAAAERSRRTGPGQQHHGQRGSHVAREQDRDGQHFSARQLPPRHLPLQDGQAQEDEDRQDVPGELE